MFPGADLMFPGADLMFLGADLRSASAPENKNMVHV